ncbi:hypothetical protein SmJEL517_g03036 [Synchytrium microbalum]|uniref:non-specific serine/threonine protein kinase n=1 Tax=Synchytrium microbalum TaxID=1806994 RepID=A0A507C5A2_9FUNG|nr:uncharacterized protein SmJEL517_g03036 [Synchytrium microbalum]TPX34299.1 hypothetical protein SmJEL517_g03036 [Synchytrium microbalum]
MQQSSPTQTRSKSELQQLQNDEVNVLKSIFGDDFVEKKTKKGVDKAFFLKLEGFGEDIRGLVGIEVHVRMGEKYPVLPPLLGLEKATGISDDQAEELQTLLIDKAKECLGNEMIFDLATLAQQYITENNVAIRRNQHRGLHAEMLSRKEKNEAEEQKKISKELREAEEIRVKAEQEEHLKQVLQYEEEIRRKQEQMDEEKQRRRRQRHASHPNHDDATTTAFNSHAALPEFIEPPLNPYLPSTIKSKSRYQTDFQELELLGKGGFGAVFKVRNRVDSRVYAVKKIRLVSSGDVSKLLREVQSLSRIQNQYIVRYYQSWFEESDGSVWHADSEDEFSSSSEDDEDSYSESIDESEEEDKPDTNSDWLASREMSRSRSFLINPNNPGGAAESTNTPSSVAVTTDSDSKSSVKPMERVLYIQMEYCEKRTLRDLIDEGPLADNEIWAYLRQIVEGLAEIHRQGMIHRDLKPGNIFLDADKNIKIGDFGLATTKTDMASDPRAIYDLVASNDIEAESLTQALGTPVYVAPEMNVRSPSTSTSNSIVGGVAGAGGKGIPKIPMYNNKVDMYSLGIVLFEMCHPFGTAMERAICLRELRRPEILFPSEFDLKRHDAKSKIIKWLLSHNPKERPSCLELLSSSLMPPMLEEEKLAEALRLMTNIENPLYFPRLSKVLFSREADKHKDAAFDFNSEANILRPELELAVKKVHDLLKVTFERHGALELVPPLLMPKTDLYDQNKQVVSLMDPDGNIVQLPYDLTVPFARYVSRVPQNVVRLKRYAFGRVYRLNRAKGQPRSVYEADFDIITATPGGSVVAEAEVIKVGIDIIYDVPEMTTSSDIYLIRVNHGCILDGILDACRFQRNVETRRLVYQILEQLDKPFTWSQIRKSLQQTFPRTCLDLLEPFATLKGDLDSTCHKLEAQLSGEALSLARTGISQLRQLISMLSLLNVRNRVVFVPTLSHNAWFCKTGLMFQICTVKKRKVDVVAAGGRYDHLLATLRLPFGRSQLMLGVGISIALDKMIGSVVSAEPDEITPQQQHKDRNRIDSAHGAEILVIALTRGHLQDRLSIVADCWSWGFSADVQYEEATLSIVDALNAAQTRGFSVVVAVRTTERGLDLKVYNLVSKSATEVSRVELRNRLIQEISHIKSKHQRMSTPPTLSDTRYQPSTPSSSTSPLTSTTPVVSDVQLILASSQQHSTKSKQKHKNKLMMQTSVKSAVASKLDSLTSVGIVGVEAPGSLLRRLCKVVDVNDDAEFRSVLDSTPAPFRE